MFEKKHMNAENKLALINEIEEMGCVVEALGKYGAGPTIFYR